MINQTNVKIVVRLGPVKFQEM